MLQLAREASLARRARSRRRVGFSAEELDRDAEARAQLSRRVDLPAPSLSEALLEGVARHLGQGPGRSLADLEHELRSPEANPRPSGRDEGAAPAELSTQNEGPPSAPEVLDPESARPMLDHAVAPRALRVVEAEVAALGPADHEPLPRAEQAGLTGIGTFDDSEQDGGHAQCWPESGGRATRPSPTACGSTSWILVVMAPRFRPGGAMAKDCYHVVTLPGDGIGVEVTAQAVRALQAAGGKEGIAFEFEELPGGGAYYLEHGREWPAGSEERCSAADAILLGAVGGVDPATGKTVFTKPGEPYETSQLAGYAQVIGNRQRLQLYANVRPVKLFPGVPHQISGKFFQVWDHAKVDYVIVRENTEEAYTGRSSDIVDAQGRVIGRQTPLEITRFATERIVRHACRLAEQRKAQAKPGKVTCVTKSNIIGAHKYFEEIFQAIAAEEFPHLTADTALFDAFCMWQMRNPEWFDVVVAPNLVGDVISDNAAITQGGLGMAAGGNIGEEHGMFEPIHGSSPRDAGLDRVNPIAAILSAAMMCDWLGLKANDPRLVRCGEAIEAAVVNHLSAGSPITFDLGGEAKCSEVGDLLVAALR